MTDEQPLWTPNADQVRQTLLYQFSQYAERQSGRSLRRYDELWRWSVEEREAFWSAVWNFCGVRGTPGTAVLINGNRMPGARWFPDARLNFAENLLGRGSPSTAAVVFWGEDKVRRTVSHAELEQQVYAAAAALRASGVHPGDCVAAFMPNMPEALVAALASASLGAIFTSTSPDFGVQGVVDRFGQTCPKVLFAVDGYWYNGKPIDCRPKLSEILARLPSVELVVVTSYLGQSQEGEHAANRCSFEQFVAPLFGGSEIEFARFPFDHPLYVLYSSGTTGVPKAIIHGAGGTLLQHLKEQQLHCDVRPGDRYFYFTTLGWTMWNILISALASGATILMYDGSPMLREGRILFDFAEAERITHFGTSAKFIDAIAKAGMRPRATHDLSAVRVVLSTGSPLIPESFDYVYEAIKPDVQLSSMSGGTDICSAFVIGNPALPVWRGEIQCRGLGMAVDVYNDSGESMPHGRGELVCTQAFPCIPLGFWNDADGSRFRSAYFERFPGVWCHGDFTEITEHGGIIIHGRSDATLNPGGVRIGTAEIYRQVERLPEVVESIAIAQRWRGDVRIVLFVKLVDGYVLDKALEDRIRLVIRENATPRHVPARIAAVSDIPRTKSGKLVELAVRDVVNGEVVRNIDALANPEALVQFKSRPELQS